MSTLRDLFIHELKDLYSAEKQLVEALPKVARAATNPELKAGIEEHLEETVEHVNRLELIMDRLDVSGRGARCKGMEGLLQEGSEMIAEEGDPEVLDAGIICSAQRIEHYEIAAYGCARTFAEMLGEDEAMELLQKTLDEEKATDEKLTELAVSSVNVSAASDEETDGTDNGRSSKSGGGRKTASRRKAVHHAA